MKLWRGYRDESESSGKQWSRHPCEYMTRQFQKQTLWWIASTAVTFQEPLLLLLSYCHTQICKFTWKTNNETVLAWVVASNCLLLPNWRNMKGFPFEKLWCFLFLFLPSCRRPNERGEAGGPNCKHAKLACFPFLDSNQRKDFFILLWHANVQVCIFYTFSAICTSKNIFMVTLGKWKLPSKLAKK